MRIGFLAADLTHKSGWAHYSLSLLNALRRAGIQVSVAAARNSPSAAGVTVQRLLPTVDPLERGMLVKQLLAAPRARQAFDGCNLIHSAIEPYAPLAAWVAGKRPLVVTGHGSYVRFSRERRFPAGAVYERAFRRSLLVCVSRYTAQQAAEAMPGITTVVVNNGIDVERFASITPGAAPRHRPTVLSVGTVKARKGTLALVRAMSEVRQQFPDVQCIIVGTLDAEPEYAAQVRAEIDALHLEDCVRLLGRIPDEALINWYATADVFAMPSLNVDWKFEGYGLSLMEASAAGLPVIGTTDCGAEDAVDDGHTGLLVSQARIAEELPNAIIRLLADPVLTRQMGQAGRARAQQQTWDHTASQMIALYDQLLK